MLSNTDKKSLKAKAHTLKPVVTVGAKGLTENVLQEIEIALNAHELIKIKLAGQDRTERPEVIQEIVSHSQSEIIQTIGAVAVIYRENQEEKS
jgi:RNA-binding protein